MRDITVTVKKYRPRSKATSFDLLTSEGCKSERDHCILILYVRNLLEPTVNNFYITAIR